MNSLWISWHRSQRSRSLAREFDVPIFEFVNEGNIVCRHLLGSLWTLYFLSRKRPAVIFLQYSFMLLLVVFLHKRIRGGDVRVICDCHTKALRRRLTNALSGPFYILKKISFKATDMCIISNHELIRDITEFSNSYFILPDPIPDFPHRAAGFKIAGCYCVYSNSYATDEPLEEVVEAARNLKGEIRIICTGRIPGRLNYLKKQPYDNIYFTDYVKDEDYRELLANAQCILALTYEESTLLCSGYEALSVDIPLVTSDTRVLREYFGDSVIFTKNTGDDIARTIRCCLKEQEHIREKMSELKRCKIEDQGLKLAGLKNRLMMLR